MIDVQALEYIEEGIDTFAEGNPLSFEIYLAEGVWFDFDNPFKQDLEEYKISVAVGVASWSPHNYGEPVHNYLEDYGTEFDDLVADLDAAIYNGSSRNESLNFEYSPRSSDPLNGAYLFVGSIHNPRMAVSSHGETAHGVHS